MSGFLSKENDFGPVYKGEPQKIDISMMHSDNGFVESKEINKEDEDQAETQGT